MNTPEKGNAKVKRPVWLSHF